MKTAQQVTREALRKNAAAEGVDRGGCAAGPAERVGVGRANGEENSGIFASERRRGTYNAGREVESLSRWKGLSPRSCFCPLIPFFRSRALSLPLQGKWRLRRRCGFSKTRHRTPDPLRSQQWFTSSAPGSGGQALSISRYEMGRENHANQTFDLATAPRYLPRPGRNPGLGDAGTPFLPDHHRKVRTHGRPAETDRRRRSG